MSSDYSKLGAVEFPLDASSVSDSLRTVADPAHELLLGLLTAAIKAECQDAFDVAKVGTKLDGYVIDASYAFSPERWLGLEQQPDFPFLAVWRNSTPEIRERTLSYSEKITEWGVAYVIGELTPFEYGRMLGLLNAVENVIITTCDRGVHPDFNDGYSIMATAGFTELQATQTAMQDWAPTQVEGAQIVAPAILITVRTSERTGTDDSGLPAFSGVDIQLDLESETEALEGLVLGDTDHKPDPPIAI